MVIAWLVLGSSHRVGYQVGLKLAVCSFNDAIGDHLDMESN